MADQADGRKELGPGVVYGIGSAAIRTGVLLVVLEPCSGRNRFQAETILRIARVITKTVHDLPDV
ncbi:hypothetical protein [Novosphingobium sp.]|uniref:hypothetical protein n=1 Tax=Novosphingobium sp. TaxID=1874826 RepID=UPI0038BA7F58